MALLKFSNLFDSGDATKVDHLNKKVPRQSWYKANSEIFVRKSGLICEETEWEYVFKKGADTYWYCTTGRYCCLWMKNLKNYYPDKPNLWTLQQYAYKSSFDCWWYDDSFTPIIRKVVEELCTKDNPITEFQLMDILDLVIEMLENPPCE